jgi:hypothetical protein
MVARDVDQAATRLRAFQVGAWEHFGLAALAFALALAATRLLPDLGVPLLIGGIVSLGLGVRDEVRRWELIDNLILDRDAYRIQVVRDRAAQAATMKSRHALASSARILLSRPELVAVGRVSVLADELTTLAARLDDEQLELDPAAAIACERLLGDVIESPLRNPSLPLEDARARIVQVLAGFRPRGA